MELPLFPVAASTTGQFTENEIWVSDSGSSHHMSYSRNGMYNFKSANERVHLAGASIRVVGRGDLHLCVDSNSRDSLSRLNWCDVVYVPSFDMHVFSFMSAARNSYTSRVTPTGTSLFHGSLHFGLYGKLHASPRDSLRRPKYSLCHDCSWYYPKAYV